MAVSATERDMVSLTKALFDGSAAMVVPILRRKGDLPAAWSPRTVAALQDVLGKGIVRWLGRRGATPRTYFGDGGAATEGRVWDCMEDPALHFTDASRRMLAWMTECDMAAPADTLVVPDAPTMADELVLACGALLLQRAGLAPVLRTQPLFARSVLVRLVALRGVETLKPLPKKAFAPWASGPGADLLVCLTDELARAWVQQEQAAPGNAEGLSIRGAAREGVLTPLVEGAIAAGRPDACSFLLTALTTLIPDETQPWDMASTPWTKPLDKTGSLAARTAARRSGLATLRSVLTLANAANKARLVGFVDDNWDSAQAQLRFYAKYDNGRFARAAQLVAHIEGVSWEEPSDSTTPKGTP